VHEPAARRDDRRALQVFERVRRARHLDHELLRADRHRAAAVARQHRVHGALDVAREKLQAGQRLGVELDAHFLSRRVPEAGVRRVRHARDARMSTGSSRS